MDLRIRQAEGLNPEAQPVEVVERKGLGHPDTICDALAEELGRALSRFYLERFGLILHYNVDKVLLWAGASRPAFGGGDVLEPFEVFLAGRATLEFRGVKVPVQELAVEHCGAWLRAHLHALDPDRHVKIHRLIRPTSTDLADLYLRQQRTGVRLANDTSCGIGSAPLSRLERMVEQVERTLNAPEFKQVHPEFGEDIKVLGIRDQDHFRLTVACAFVDRFVNDLDAYLAGRSHLEAVARNAVQTLADGRITVEVNTADDPASGSVYLTVTGTSAEAGDDGQAGRGNRANGLITPHRPMSMESVAGKNPVTHVGRLYNLAALRIAESIVQEIDGVETSQCGLVSQIGRPVEDPQLADVRIETVDGRPASEFSSRVEEIVRGQLAHMNDLVIVF